MRLALALALLAAAGAASAQPDPAGIAGDWGGRLDVGVMVLPVIFHFTADDAGYSATLDSPDQGAFGIPAEVAVVASAEGAADSLRVTVTAIGGLLAGRVAPDRSAIAATWSQGGQTFASFTLTREGANVTVRLRPQEPQEPFPYLVEEVTFEGAPGVSLAGTVTRPEGEGPFPAVVLVTGSGPQDRDEALLGHRPFAVLADHLTRNGVAVLRYDDRGIGGSTGDFAGATSVDLASDAAAAVRFLNAQAYAGRVGIVGHSEGGVLGPMVAAQTDALEFLVLLAGTAVRGDAVIAHQGARIARAQGLSEAGAVDNERWVGQAMLRIVAVPLDEPIPDSVRAAVLADFRAAYAAMTPEDRVATGATDAAASDAELVAAAGRMDEPWLRYFLAYDPAPALRALRVPTLALFGEKDLQVLPDQNAGPMRDALAASGVTGSEVVVLDGLNHLFQTAPGTGGPREYADIEETMSPIVLDRVAAWILETAGR